jgi:hypothetical protein
MELQLGGDSCRMENFLLKDIPGILWHYKLPQTHRCLDQTVNVSRENRCIAARKNLIHLLFKKSIPTCGFEDGDAVFMGCNTAFTSDKQV